MKFTYKTEAELTKMTPEQRDQYAVDKREYEAAEQKKVIDAAVKEALDAHKLANPIPKAYAGVEITQKMWDEQQEKISQLLEDGAGLAGKGGKNPILDFCKTNFEAIKAAHKKNERVEFICKADTRRSSVTNNPNALDLAGIGQLAFPQLALYDVFRKVPVPVNANGVVRYTDWDAATTARAAAAVAEGAAFPESTAKWQGYTLTIYKVGDSIPVSEEFFYDAAMFAAELEAFLRTNVMIKINNDLVTGDGNAPNIKGLSAYVPNYAPAAAGIADPTIYDLLVKVRSAITIPYGSKYAPNISLMNDTDIDSMKLSKDANGNYVMPPFVDQNGNRVSGMLIIPSNQVTANTMFVGDNRFAAIYEEPGFTVETGYSGTDFTDDMKHLKARKRLNLLIRTVDQTGWLEVTDIQAALAVIGQAV